MAEYKTHGFNKEWHKKVEEFIEETDQPFENAKYFIKYCVNQYIQQETDKKNEIEKAADIQSKLVSEIRENPDKTLNDILEEIQK